MKIKFFNVMFLFCFLGNAVHAGKIYIDSIHCEENNYIIRVQEPFTNKIIFEKSLHKGQTYNETPLEIADLPFNENTCGYRVFLEKLTATSFDGSHRHCITPSFSYAQKPVVHLKRFTSLPNGFWDEGVLDIFSLERDFEDIHVKIRITNKKPKLADEK